MEIATYLLFILGLLGAADIAIFHSVAHGIRSHPDSAMELFTHSLRGPTYAALFILIPNFKMHGVFAWLLIALFVVDLGISVWDFWLEQESRRFLGGLPSGEYVLHVVIAMLFGGLVTSVMLNIGPWIKETTALVYSPAQVPWLLRLIMAVMAPLVFISGLQDAVAAFKLKGKQHRNRPTDSTNPAPANVSAVKASRDRNRSLAWMRWVLYAAGAYNLVWGSFVIFFPSVLFKWAGMAPINYPEVWQCVGMVVGVYGIGYLIAARDPFRHWPIVLVGLLGKLFGPLGMVWAVAKGTLPLIAGFACVTNDLIWWIPFAVILSRAYAHHLLRSEHGDVQLNSHLERSKDV